MTRLVTVFTFLNILLPAAPIPAQDSRNTDIPDMNTHFRMPAFPTRESWLTKAVFLRNQILASAGLLPLPEKPPVHVQIFGRLERQGYSVEKVLLETYPGFYLGGNLYRPLGKQGPFPGVLSPHGHWAYGRLENTDRVSVPARCINLARKGFVVFSYDMVGYNDTNQFPHGDNPTALGGPREDLWNINVMGLQLWNSMRALDFLTTLPDVDATRMAATGASGGGTQTFLLMATDDRIKVAAPVNMISAIMQGNGCEEAANLRVGAFNVMFGAMMAPRPLLMVSATGDWTVNTPKEEYPAIQGIYRLMGAEANVEMVQIDQKHNYSKESREAVYTFFNARLLGGKGPVQEQRYRVEQVQDLLALFEKPRPANAVTMEQYVNDRIAEAKDGIERLAPSDAATLDAARTAFRQRLTFALLDMKPGSDEVLFEKTSASPDREDLVLGRADKGDRIPAAWLAPKAANPRVSPTLIVHPDGVAWVVNSGLAKGILERGGTVLAIDAFQSGSAKAPREHTRRAFTVFNQTDDANRVQDILTALSWLQGRTHATHVNLIGLEAAGVWSYFARAMAGPGVNLAADLARFRANTDQEYLDKFNVPGLRKAGDFRAASVLDTQDKLLVYNPSEEFPADWAAKSSHIANTRALIHKDGVTDAQLIAWATE